MSLNVLRAALRNRLVHSLAPVAAVLLAACSAATAPEEYGSTESHIDEPEEEGSSTSSSGSTVPEALVGGGGFACDATNVTMPTTLPDVTKCINDANAATDNAADCRGWSPVGDYLTTSAELRSAETLGAQLYSIRPDATTLCLYLYRGDRAVSAATLNGLHCYNTTTCDVCWWDGATNAGTAPAVADLKHESADSSKCSKCHRNGPVLPKASLWNAAETLTRRLSATCGALGGPTWHQAEAGWGFTTPDRATIVAAPTTCRGGSCHGSFASGGNYCTMVGHAFADEGGSMRGGAGVSFATNAECTAFRTAMGCPETRPADPNTPFLDCDDTNVAPALTAGP